MVFVNLHGEVCVKHPFIDAFFSFVEVLNVSIMSKLSRF